MKGLPSDEATDGGPQRVVVCDAEAHMYGFLEVVLKQGLDFIVRAADARSFTEDDQALFEAVAQQAVEERFTLSLKRRPDRLPREAQVALRFGQVTLKRPKRTASQRASLTLGVVDIIEPNPPVLADWHICSQASSVLGSPVDTEPSVPFATRQ